jgi:tRNA pseudouridine55 synthase
VHGWIILDKPAGIGSTPAVGAVKRALRGGDYPRRRVGHGGTLDPLASGVLPIAIGEATKLAGRMLDADKVYRFAVAFGGETDTLDAEGAVVATSPVRPSSGEIAAILPEFTGEIVQIPPAYSALKIDGRRAYARARAGETVEPAPRQVTVHRLELLDHDGETAVFEAQVSKGTYIRSLARDLARALGSAGHVTMLRRTKAGPFNLDQAISLDKLAELGKGRALDEALLPLVAGLDDIPALAITTDQAGRLQQGRKLVGIAASPGLYLAIDGDLPVALVEVSGSETRVVRGFTFDDTKG